MTRCDVLYCTVLYCNVLWRTVLSWDAGVEEGVRIEKAFVSCGDGISLEQALVDPSPC